MVELMRSPIGCTTENPKPDAFIKWCGKNKVLWDKCAMGMSQTTGRCVVAKQLIRKGEVVVEVPDDAVLMGENCQIQLQLAEEGLLKPAEDALLEVQGLIIGVMYEKALGKKSRWEPYLSFLPQDMSHMLIYWTEAELNELRGTAAHDKLIGKVQHAADAPTRMTQLFEELVLPFVQANAAVRRVLVGKAQHDITAAAKDKLWSHYQWATAVVASYSFVLGDDQYQGLVPVWDLLNHITGKANVRLHHDAARGVLQMVATNDIPEGAEVVNCYGNLSNAELLRGYGYVEQHNSVQHVHVPAQFLIRAAAGAAAGTARGNAAAAALQQTTSYITQQQQRQHGSSNDADDQGKASHPVSSDESDDDQPEASSGHGDDASERDESSQDDADSSDDDEDDEPDWDLEDDSEDLHLLQQQPAPTLDKSMQQISDWEDRWQLCFSMKLLPKNNVFQLPAGGVDTLPQQLLSVLLLLLADAADCEKLAAVAAAATSKAAAAAKAAAVAAHARKHGNSGKKQKGKKQQTTVAAAAAARLAAHSSTGIQHAVKQELAVLAKMQFSGADVMHAALLLLVHLMQSRYTCSAADDQQLLGKLAELPPRLAAAVVARSSEKRVLQQLEHDLQQQHVQQDLLERARQALRETVLQLATAAAAAAMAHGHTEGCCHTSGCLHTLDERCRQEEQDGGKTQQQQQQQQPKGKRKKLNQQREEMEDAEEQQQQKKGGRDNGRCGKKRSTNGIGEQAAATAAVEQAALEAGKAVSAGDAAAGRKKRQKQQAPPAADRAGTGSAAFAFNFQV